MVPEPINNKLHMESFHCSVFSQKQEKYVAENYKYRFRKEELSSDTEGLLTPLVFDLTFFFSYGNDLTKPKPTHEIPSVQEENDKEMSSVCFTV